MLEKLRAYSMAKELSMDRARGGVDDDDDTDDDDVDDTDDDDTDDDDTDDDCSVSEAEEVMGDEVAMWMDK